MPPVSSTAFAFLAPYLWMPRPPPRAVHIAREPGPNLVEIDAELHRVGVRARLALRGGVLPPTVHPRFELVGHRGPEPGVQPGDLADRVGLHGPKVDVVEPIVGTGRAEPQRPLHAQRPMLDVEPADVAAVDPGVERPDDVGVQVGHRQQDVGGIAMGHHESGVRDHRVQRVEPQHMGRALQPPRPLRLAPLQQLHHPPLIAKRRGEVGVVHEPR
jgi:hypothetical protein